MCILLLGHRSLDSKEHISRSEEICNSIKVIEYVIQLK